MSRNLAVLISFVFHPLLMPTYAMLLLLNMNTYLAFSMSAELKRIVLGTVLLTTFILPLLLTMVFVQKGLVSNLYLVNAKDRIVPFLSTAIIYFAAFYLLNQLPIPRIFAWIILSGGIAIFLTFILNFKWKLSIHMVAMGALAGLIFSLPQLMMIEVFTSFVSVIILGGIVGTARLTTGSHNIAEVSIGYLLGFLTVWIVMYNSDMLSMI